MNVLLILGPKYGITEVTVFIQTLPPTATLFLCGPSDPVNLCKKIARRNGVPVEVVDTDYPEEGISYASSQVWYLNARRNKSWYDMTVRFAAAGKLLKGYYPSRFSSRKNFVLCSVCNSLHGEGYHIEFLKHCQHCCADHAALITISATGPALVALHRRLNHQVLTPEGRKVWPYAEKDKIEVFSDEQEWIDLAEKRRRADFEGQVKANTTSLRNRDRRRPPEDDGLHL